MNCMPTSEQVTEALRSVIDPELRRDIVELEMVRSIDVHANGVVDVMVSLTTPGCPIRSHFETGVATAIRGLDGVTGVNVTFDVLSDDEKAALGRKLGRGGLPEGALAQVKNVICIGSGKGGVGKSSVTANLAAALAADGKTGGRARRRRLGLLAAPHARPRRRAPEGQRGAQAHPHRRPRRHQGDVDRLLRRAGRRRRVARPDAPQGAPAVPGGRRLGRARLPADRPAARHRRRLDDAGPAAAAGQVPDRDHAAAGGPEGGPPLGRDGGQAQARDRRRDREHVRLRHPGRRALPDLRRGRRSAAGRGARRAAAGQGAAHACRCASSPTAGLPLVLADPDDPAAQALRHGARGLIALIADRAAGACRRPRRPRPPSRPACHCRWPRELCGSAHAPTRRRVHAPAGPARMRAGRPISWRSCSSPR